MNIGSGRSLGNRRLLVGVGAVVLVGAGAAFYMHGRTAIADEQALLTSARAQLADVQTLVVHEMPQPTASGGSDRQRARRRSPRSRRACGRHRLARRRAGCQRRQRTVSE